RERTYAEQMDATFREQAHKDAPRNGFQVPSGAKGSPIDPESGKRPTPDCPKSRVMYFEKGTAPISFCGEHTPDKGGNESNDDDVPVNREKKGLFRRIIEKFF